MINEFIYPLVLSLDSNSEEVVGLKAKVKEIVKSHGYLSISYMKTVKKMIVLFDSESGRMEANNKLNDISDFSLNFILEKVRKDSEMLKIPELGVNFLISPPPSPPEGWESTKEKPPVVHEEQLNEEEFAKELIMKLSKPNEKYELIEGNEEIPSVILHTAPEVTDNPKLISMKSVSKNEYTISRP